MKLSKLLLSVVLFSFLAKAEQFVIDDVRVDGLQRITAGSFFNYLPVKQGQTIDESDFSSVIRELYKTDFFENIDLAKEGNTLVITVQERPIIGTIEIEGNNHVKSKDILSGLVAMGLGEGDTFSTEKLNRIERELFNLYYSRSKLDVIINGKAIPLNDNRVALKINIREGISARIKKINITGNKAFSEKSLLRQISLEASKFNSIISKSDQYSGAKLEADIEALESYYMDRGFLDFTINSTQVSLTDDKKDVYITINVSEGYPYRIAGTTFTSTDIINKNKLSALLDYNVGQYYSRDTVRSSLTSIKNALGDLGYAFANVKVVPAVNKEIHEVAIKYAINPGRKVYVRRIKFKGNYKTNDEVLRREMRQIESSAYNHTKLERSVQRLQRLRYITSVKRTERSVPNKPDQVDVIYEVIETPNQTLTGGVGYGPSSGAMFNASYSTANFLGTGNLLSFDFSNSSSERSYYLDFTDPYFSPDGVSRSVSLYLNEKNEDKINDGDWATDNLGAFLRFGFPVDEYESFRLGAGYRNTKVNTGSTVTQEVPAWLNEHGNDFDEFVLDFNWTHDTRDSTTFANKGSVTRFNAEVVTPGSTETYYKLGLRNRSYFKVSDKLITSVRGDISYGDGYGDSKDLPFFKNYYAGGLTTVRGYQSNTLGPRWNNGDVKGGQLRVTGGAELIFPWYLGQDDESIRLGSFADFGNVFADSEFDVDDFRYSAGLFLLWDSPIGALNVSYGVPLNDEDGDKIERFQFTLGVPL